MNERKRADIYRSIATLAESGVDSETLFATLRRSFRSSWSRSVVQTLARAVLSGAPLSDGMAAAGSENFPAHHALAVRAAEISGRVPPMLRALADEEDTRRAAREHLISRSIYPILLLHAAAIAPNAGLAVNDFGAFIASVLAIVIPVDLLLGLLLYCLVYPNPARAWARLTLRLPLAGTFVRARDYRAYFSTLHHLYEAGVPLPSAAGEALEGLQNPILKAHLEAVLAPLRENQPLALAVEQFPGLREEVRALLITAEPAGELGPALRSAANHCAEELAKSRGRLLKVSTGALLTVAFAYVTVRVITFWADYYGTIAGL